MKIRWLALVCAIWVLSDSCREAVGADPVIVAHRGLLRHAPENTLANFRASIELGIGFEFDVARTADGHLVCIHDDSVGRTTGGQGIVSEMTLAELRKLDAGRWFDTRFAGQKIPTIDEVLALIASSPNSGAVYAADLKARDVERDIVELAVKHGVLNRLVFIGRTISEPSVREKLKRASPQASTAVVANVQNEFAVANAAAHSDWVYFRYLPAAEEVRAVHARGARTFIAGSTVGGSLPENWQNASAAGIDAILTDYPLELAETLRSIRNSRK